MRASYVSNRLGYVRRASRPVMVGRVQVGLVPAAEDIGAALERGPIGRHGEAAAQVRAGFPCSARYQPGNPQNSIVVAEEWSGLRAGMPVFPEFEDPDPIGKSHLESLRPGRG